MLIKWDANDGSGPGAQGAAGAPGSGGRAEVGPRAGVEAAGHRDVTMRNLRGPGSPLASVFPSVNRGAGASLARAIPSKHLIQMLRWSGRSRRLCRWESLPLHVCACVCAQVCACGSYRRLFLRFMPSGPGFSILCLSLNFLLYDGTEVTPSEEWYRHRQGPLCASRLSVRI